MPRFLPNDPVAQNRRGAIVLFQDDGVTRIVATTALKGTKASRRLGGLSAALSGLTVTYYLVGVGGNAFTLALAADGVGAGSITNVGSAYTFHFQSGVTTVTNFIAQVAGVTGIFSVTGAYNGANTLGAGDVTAALKLAGGSDNSLFARPGNTQTEGAAAGVVYGILRAAVAQAGRFEYEFTQAELNHSACKTMLAFDRVPDPAMLDLSTKTAHCGTIVYDKVAVGSDGNINGENPVTIALANDGDGAGLLDHAGAAWTFHFQPGTTTDKNFEDAIVASARFAIWQYTSNWTTLLADPADTFAATNLSGGASYKFDEINFDMRAGDFDCAGENGDTYGDIQRDIRSTVCEELAGPYAGGALHAKSDDGTKTRRTFTCDGTQRLSAKGDLTP